MKVYECTDGEKRLFLKVRFTLTKYDLILCIAWKTSAGGKQITDFIKGTTTPWTRKKLIKEITAHLRTSGQEFSGVDDATDQQMRQATRIIERYFPDLGEGENQCKN